MRLFRRNRDSDPEHAVITYLPLAGGEFGSEEEQKALYALEERIEKAVRRIGEFDGNEIGEGQAVLYTYGRDADALFDAIKHALGDIPLRPGAKAVKRYGPAEDADARTETVPLA
jgi:hypothetical protein